MQQLSLNGEWKMRPCGGGAWLAAQVPGSVICDLMKAGQLTEPYYRDQEAVARAMMENDFEYKRCFQVDAALLACDRVFLSCEGLDTLAQIFLNEVLIGSTDDMHRTYQFEVKKALQAGANIIHICFASSLQYIRLAKQNTTLSTEVDVALPGFAAIRKAHSMFGWDSEPAIPDAGIWRDIALVGYGAARIEQAYFRQAHEPERVTLTTEIELQKWTADVLDIELSVTDPSGKVIRQKRQTSNATEVLSTIIEQPQLWWPNDFGAQPLYSVCLIVRQKASVVDQKTYSIGLRTFQVRREADAWGESFEFVVNGVPIFAKGANYIPIDKFTPRARGKRMEQMVMDCVAAHFNCIRIWGGGFFPDDEFFDFCDRNGILVWHDLMFACALYKLTDEFIANIKAETQDNIRRLRHHPSLALWCGNNENEMGLAWWRDFGKFNAGQIKAEYLLKFNTEYLLQYEQILRQVVNANDPDRFYWPSSPHSSPGLIEDTNLQTKGDAHEWSVWHSSARYENYRKTFSRFTSEFGNQSFPSFKTLQEYMLPEDLTVGSEMLDLHQRNAGGDGNAKIVHYILHDFQYPENFEDVVYASQIVQAESMKCGVEHWRRNRGRCMGALYWMLQDCWPAPTWAGIDSRGRWKALHYYARRFYQPVLISADDREEAVDLYVVNDTREPVTGEIKWYLRSSDSTIIRQETLPIVAEKLSATNCCTLNLTAEIVRHNKNRVYLEFCLFVGGAIVSSSTLLFVKPKHFRFLNPALQVKVEDQGDAFQLTCTSSAYARDVSMDLVDSDCQFSDNWFDLSKGDAKIVRISKASLSTTLSVAELKDQLAFKSVYQLTKHTATEAKPAKVGENLSL